MNRIFGLTSALASGIILLYISRFWSFNLWSRDGLFGIKELPPTGGLLGRWLRGTDFAPFELLIWVAMVFLALTYLQRGIDRFSKH